MKICILVTNEHVEEVRQTARDNNIGGSNLLNIPASPTGYLPATHWFCHLKATEKMRDKLFEIRTWSEMVVTDDWGGFLDSKGLKLCMDHL